VQARSLVTRVALLDATLAALCEHGYGALSTNEVASRAGVSRGALLHHFPSKAALVSAAAEHVLARRLAEFEAAVASAPADAVSIDAAIDLVWSLFDGPAFTAWAELWVAARTDDELARTMLDVEVRFTDQSRVIAVRLLSGLEFYDPDVVALLRDFVFAVMNGLAFERLVSRPRRVPSEHLSVLKSAAHNLLESGGGSP
jgi:AcrR family transcriptional regulator